VLGEDQLAVDEDVELTGFADLERGVEAGFLLDRGRETRGAGFVVSDEAVLDDDALAHGRTMARRGAGGNPSGAPAQRPLRRAGAHGGRSASTSELASRAGAP
jgi:hypothetical protein